MSHHMVAIEQLRGLVSLEPVDAEGDVDGLNIRHLLDRLQGVDDGIKVLRGRLDTSRACVHSDLQGVGKRLSLQILVCLWLKP